MVNGPAGVDIFYTIRRFSELEPVNIDGLVFRLHFWVTSSALFAASMIAFAKQYFGDPIECIFVSITQPRTESLSHVFRPHFSLHTPRER